MSIDTTHDLFVNELQHAYYTEQRLLDALSELESSSSQEELEEGFSEHHAETQGHVERIEEVFDRIDESPETAEDSVVEAMIEAHEEFTGQDPSDAALDRYNIAAGQKSEHYEIAVYGNLIPLADQEGHDEVANLLEENLREEQSELDSLSELGEQFDYGQLSG